MVAQAHAHPSAGADGTYHPGADGEPGWFSGRQCSERDYSTLARSFVCPLCGATMADARFPASGVVWSFTVVRVRVPDRESPYGLVYVDLDGPAGGGSGPRALVNVPAAEVDALTIGDRVSMHSTAGRLSISTAEVSR